MVKGAPCQFPELAVILFLGVRLNVIDFVISGWLMTSLNLWKKLWFGYPKTMYGFTATERLSYSHGSQQVACIWARHVGFITTFQRNWWRIGSWNFMCPRTSMYATGRVEAFIKEMQGSDPYSWYLVIISFKHVLKLFYTYTTGFISWNFLVKSRSRTWYPFSSKLNMMDHSGYSPISRMSLSPAMAGLRRKQWMRSPAAMTSFWSQDLKAWWSLVGDLI